MAYLKKLRTCDENNCGATATVELMDRLNNSFGKFCERHGRHRLAVLKKVEDEATPGPTEGKVLDLMAALKQSLADSDATGVK